MYRMLFESSDKYSIWMTHMPCFLLDLLYDSGQLEYNNIDEMTSECPYLILLSLNIECLLPATKVFSFYFHVQYAQKWLFVMLS